MVGGSSTVGTFDFSSIDFFYFSSFVLISKDTKLGPCVVGSMPQYRTYILESSDIAAYRLSAVCFVRLAS